MDRREALGVFTEFIIDVAVPNSDNAFSLTPEFIEARNVLISSGIDWQMLGAAIDASQNPKKTIEIKYKEVNNG
jgi:hypothetical protein